MSECTNTIPERRGGQECVSPMAAHVGCEYTIAVPNEEGRDDTKDFWGKASVDEYEPVQCKPDACVHSVGYIFDLRNLGKI